MLRTLRLTISGRLRFAPAALIGRQVTGIPRKTRIRTADTPKSRSFGGDPLPLDIKSHHTSGIFLLKTVTDRMSR